jgi:hypothetical protein
MREQVRKMSLQLDTMGARLERIDVRMCRLERTGPSRSCEAAVLCAGNAPGPFRVAVIARAMRLLDLPAELLVAIASQLVAIASIEVRKAVAGTEQRASGARLSTSIGTAFSSVRGQLEQLSWLRARGYLWEPTLLARWRGSVLERGCGRASARAAVGARGWMPVG